MATTVQSAGVATRDVRVNGAAFRLRHHHGAAFISVLLLGRTVDGELVGSWAKLDTECPERSWFGRIAEWRGNTAIPLRTLYEQVWQFYADRCPDEARKAVASDAR